MRRIICITGMPGAGKTTVAEAASSLGLPTIAMGDLVREVARQRGLKLGDEELGALAERLREEKGSGAVAELCLSTLDRLGGDVIVIDGVRSPAEVEAFRRWGKVKVLAIFASQEKRFELIRLRKRSDAPLDEGQFKARDERELGFGIGELLALADAFLINDFDSAEELKERAKVLFRRFLDEGDPV